MAKKMITIKVEDDGTVELLKALAKSQNRSQGAQVEFMVKDQAKKLNITVGDKVL